MIDDQPPKRTLHWVLAIAAVIDCCIGQFLTQYADGAVRMAGYAMIIAGGALLLGTFAHAALSSKK